MPPATRRSTKWLISAYLVIQVALPLNYYVNHYGEGDERFAWRMFSSTRVRACELVVLDTAGQRFPLHSRFHEAWITIANRGNRNVVDRMVDVLCEEGQGVERVALFCTSVDGAASQPIDEASPCL